VTTEHVSPNRVTLRHDYRRNSHHRSVRHLIRLPRSDRKRCARWTSRRTARRSAACLAVTAGSVHGSRLPLAGQFRRKSCSRTFGVVGANPPAAAAHASSSVVAQSANPSARGPRAAPLLGASQVERRAGRKVAAAAQKTQWHCAKVRAAAGGFAPTERRRKNSGLGECRDEYAVTRAPAREAGRGEQTVAPLPVSSRAPALDKTRLCSL